MEIFEDQLRSSKLKGKQETVKECEKSQPAQRRVMEEIDHGELMVMLLLVILIVFLPYRNKFLFSDFTLYAVDCSDSPKGIHRILRAFGGDKLEWGLLDEEQSQDQHDYIGQDLIDSHSELPRVDNPVDQRHSRCSKAITQKHPRQILAPLLSRQTLRNERNNEPTLHYPAHKVKEQSK